MHELHQALGGEPTEPIFDYTRDQLVSLKHATIITSSMSLVSSCLIIIVYFYMLIYHRKEANQVSLRCVFLFCLSDTLNSILNIIITFERGDIGLCRAAGVLIGFSVVYSTSLLTIVGINLILIFVINVKRRDRLERIYYTAAFLYSTISISVSIYNQATADSNSYSKLTCWYLRYIQDRTYSMFAWMWFYAFIFFANLTAIVCSIAAMTKLVLEQRMLAISMQHINKDSIIINRTPQDNSFKKKMTKVLTKVVLRCIAYPLVPFLANIFGFTLQMIITTTTTMTPPFAFVMLDTVFSCSGGVFITVVFFTDPVIANVLSSTYKGWYTKYVEEYTLIPADGCVPLQNDRFMTANSTSSSLVFENEMPFILTNSMPKCSLKEHTGGAMPHVGLLTTAEFTSDSKNQFRHATKMTPMRKFRLLHRDFTDNSQRNRLNSTVVSTIIPPRAIIARNGRHFQRHQQQMHSLIPLMSPDLHNIYIPYRFPSIATYIHNVLVALDRFRTFKLRKREEHFATDQSNRNRESQFRDNRQKHPNQHYSLSKDRQESNITLCINPTECTTATETVSNNNLDQTLTNIPLVMYNNLHTSAITSPLIDVNYNRNNDRCSVDSMTESI